MSIQCIIQNLDSIIGATEPLVLTFTDDDGNAFDVSTYDFFFTLKTDNDLPDSSATIKKEPTDFTVSGAGNNIATATLSDTDTLIDAGNCFYDVKAIDSSGNVTYAAIGNYTFYKRSTQRTS